MNPFHSFSPEFDLVLACAQVRDGPEHPWRLASLLRGDLDWDFACRQLTFHGLRPLAYRALSHAAPDRIPPRIIRYLKSAYQASAAHNLSLTQELFRILDRFGHERVGAISFKGPLQASQLYGNIALRETSDLDILIRKDDFAAARRVLTEFGYAMKVPLTPEQERRVLTNGNEHVCNFYSSEQSILVELHWNIVSPHSAFGLTSDALWTLARPIVVAGRTFSGFPPEELFLLLAIHIEKHGWQILRFIGDLARMIEHEPALDWGHLLDLAQGLNRPRLIPLAVFLCHVLYGSPIPDRVRGAIEADKAMRMDTALIRSRLLRHGFHLPGYREWRANWLLVEELALADGARITNGASPAGGRRRPFLGYLRSILQIEYPDRQRFKRLPRRLFFIYFFMRILRYIKFHTYLRYVRGKEARKISQATDGAKNLDANPEA